jgi:hypothetical protein
MKNVKLSNPRLIDGSTDFRLDSITGGFSYHKSAEGTGFWYPYWDLFTNKKK